METSLFSKEDTHLLASLKHDPNAKPLYDAFQSVLIWPDETPKGLSPEGADTLALLMAARASIHHGRDTSIFPKHYVEWLHQVWNRAVAENLKWTGFEPSRLKLADCDMSYMENQMAIAAQSDLL